MTAHLVNESTEFNKKSRINLLFRDSSTTMPSKLFFIQAEIGRKAKYDF